MPSEYIHERAEALGFRIKGRTVYQSPGKVLFTGKTNKEVLAYLLGWEHAVLSRCPGVDLQKVHLLGSFKVKD
jgi:hypothetical protein